MEKKTDFKTIIFCVFFEKENVRDRCFIVSIYLFLIMFVGAQ